MPTQSRGHGTHSKRRPGPCCSHAHAKPWAWHPFETPPRAVLLTCPRKAVGMAPGSHALSPSHAHAKPWAWHPVEPSNDDVASFSPKIPPIQTPSASVIGVRIHVGLHSQERGFPMRRFLPVLA